MTRCKLFYIILVSLIYYAASEEIVDHVGSNTSNKGEPPDKLPLVDLQSQPDQKSFMSRLFEWVLPFGSPAEDRRDVVGGYSYPTPSQSHIVKDCNPCNREPWIPIIPNFGRRPQTHYAPSPQNFVHRPPVQHFAHTPPVQHFVHAPPVQNFANAPSQFSDSSVLETLQPPPVLFRRPLVKYPLPTYNREVGQQTYSSVPVTVVDYMVPPPINYKVPSLIYGPSKSVSYTPPANHEFAGSNTPMLPQTINYNQYQEQLPTFPFIHPPPPPDNLPNLNQYHEVLNDALITDNALNVPSDSYGVPVTGDSLNYVTFSEPLSLPNEHKEYVEKPIPLPNLSSFPVLPFRNYDDFKRNFDSNQQGDKTQVEVENSVRVADYLASIDHPVNVIQSPIIELSIADNEKPYEGVDNENSKLIHSKDNREYSANDENSNSLSIRKDKAQKTYSNINEKLQYTKLSENPIVVEDVHAAASSNNDTFVNSNESEIRQNIKNNNQNVGTEKVNPMKELLLHQKSDIKPTLKSNYTITQSDFTAPPMDYSSWKSSYGFKSSENSTTKKPKVIQIIVPYITNREYEKEWKVKNEKYYPQKYDGSYSTLLPMFVPPETTQESLWTKFSTPEAKPVVPTTTAVYNIKELINQQTKDLPFDIITLQKHIDAWTQQAYSQNVLKEKEVRKEIPSEFFTTQRPLVYDFEQPEKEREQNAEESVDINLVVPPQKVKQETISTTEMSTTTKAFSNVSNTVWNVSKVAISAKSKEKVYIVTPQAYSFYTSTPATAWSSAPKVENGQAKDVSGSESYKFSIRVEPEHKASSDKSKNKVKKTVKIVYSEWPHLINNLQTTTKKPSSRHPLFGLMDISEYTPINPTTDIALGQQQVTSATIFETETRKSSST